MPGDDDENEDWLIRTELAPRPSRPVPVPEAEPPPPPVEKPFRPVFSDPDLGLTEVSLKPIGMVLVVATEAEAARVFTRKTIPLRNPFTREITPFEELVIDRERLEVLPHLRLAPEAMQTLCNDLEPHLKSVNDELLVYVVPLERVDVELAKAAVDHGALVYGILDVSLL